MSFNGNQMQAWPTPEIFIRRQEGGKVDFVNANYALLSVDFVFPASVTTSDAIAADYGLLSMLVNGKQPISTNEDVGSVSYALNSFVNVAGYPVTPATETANSNYALLSFVNITKQDFAEAESFNVSYGLLSMTV